MKTCTKEGCDRPFLARGFCSMHYQQARSAGMGKKPAQKPIARFRAKTVTVNGCWIWQGAKTYNGYGQFRFDGQIRYAHRWSYEHHVGAIPEGKVLDHLCRTPSCVNPKHLEPVTQRINVLRGESPAAKQARQTHCRKAGHPLSGSNLSISGGKRRCRECYRAWDRERTARRNAARRKEAA